MEKEEIKELVKEEITKLIKIDDSKAKEDTDKIRTIAREEAIREITEIRSRLGFKGMFDKKKLQEQIRGIIDFELGEFKKEIMNTALKRNQRTHEIILETVKGLIGEKISEDFIKDVISSNLTNKLEPFVMEIVKRSYHKFSSQISKGLKDMINLKTSTIMEIKEVIETIPVEFADDKEFYEAIVHKDWKLLDKPK